MKRILCFLALVFLSAKCCNADALFVSVKATPYDRQMARIRSALSEGRTGSANGVSLVAVNHWMSELRNVPYAYHRVWQTPRQVESGAPADCKGKAVALYRRMKAHGARNLRLVIGRRTMWSGTTHAWLEWNTARGNYVLDPTFNTDGIPSNRLGSHSYVPLYAYAGQRKFRASAARLVRH
jgi:predicted transglutaminase-like cysteine proteinase